MNERAKSANDPTVFDGVTDYLKNMFGMGPKDSGNSLAAGSVAEGQMRVPDNRKFDVFGNESATEIDFPNSFSSRPEPEGYNTVINPFTGLKELRYDRPDTTSGIGTINKEVTDSVKNNMVSDAIANTTGFYGR